MRAEVGSGLINATAAADLNYRFDLYPNFWVEPTVGAQGASPAKNRELAYGAVGDHNSAFGIHAMSLKRVFR